MMGASMFAGTVVGERFTLERRAGAGAMGTVYRARDRRSGEVVALKVMEAGGPASAERFVREAEILAALSHPGIVRYVAHGRLADGRLYLAMEWLDGVDLAELLETRGLSIADGIALAASAAAALGAAHARGVVHRDVKPSNLFLVSGAIDRVKVIDFGIARLSTYTRMTTRTGAVIGTPGYLAPEQARGEREIDPAADVFSLGCVLFEMLTGRRPFVGDHLVAVLAKILVDPAPRLRELLPDAPLELDELLARMLDKDPAQRPQDGAAVAAELCALASMDSEGGAARLVARAPPKPALTAREQRLVSVALVAPRDDEEVSCDTPTVALDDVLDTRARIGALVSGFGGRLAQLADGSFLAMLSGAGSASAQAVYAARCALALRAALPDAAVVLATGLGVVAERLPVGEAIDRAARMLADAAPGSVRIDDTTAELVEPLFEIAGAPGARELRGERDGEEPVRTLLGRASPYVGRERELGMLERLFDDAVSEPAASAALVTAPPGAGKTRLRQELGARLAGRAKIWIGAGDPLGTGSPFGLLGRAARRAFGVRASDPGEAQAARLRERVATRLGGEEGAHVAEFLGELFDVPLGGEPSVQLRAARQDAVLMGDRMRWAFERLLRAETAQEPLVIVLEDLHWGDLATVKLVDAALRDLSDCPLLVLALARPEVDDRFPALWRERGVLRLSLGPLSKRAGERLAREHLGGLADTAEIARLVDRAEGNALYLEELIRASAESKSSASGGGDLPATVLAMLEARLERLDPEARRLLRAASIFGPAFRESGVRALLGGAERTDVVRELLRDLVEREVLVAIGAPAGEAAYAFRHALVRDAAYTTLTDADRALGHRLAGSFLEQMGERDAGLLGEHFERGGEKARAAARYVHAAEQALAGDDLEAALAWSARAIACGAAAEELGAARRVEAEAHAFRGANAEAARAGDAALGLLRRGSAAFFQAAADVATAKSRLGDHAAVEALGAELAAAEAEPAALGPLLVALARTAILLLHQGLEERVARLLARIEAIRGAADPLEPTARGWLERLRAVMALHAGDPAEYLALTTAAAASFEAAGDQRTASVQRGNVGYAYLELGAFAEAERELRAARAASEALGAHHNVMLIQHNLGLAIARPYEAGEPPPRPRDEALAEAIALEAEAMEVFAAHSHPRLEGYSRMYLARIHAIAGDLDEAARLARDAARTLAPVPPSRAIALATLAELALARGAAAEALAFARDAMEVLASMRGIEEGESLIRLAHAEALHATGDLDGARAAIADARDRLVARAARISHAALRETFLRRLPEHARTLALAEAWAAPR
jgi:eukaryotic-like serine/threonine-protein kinase